MEMLCRRVYNAPRMANTCVEAINVLRTYSNAVWGTVCDRFEWSRLLCIGGRLLPEIYSAIDEQRMPNLPRIADIEAGQHPDIYTLLVEASQRPQHFPYKYQENWCIDLRYDGAQDGELTLCRITDWSTGNVLLEQRNDQQRS